MLVNLVLYVMVNALALGVASVLLRGIRFSGSWLDLVLVGVVFGVVNSLVKPVVQILTLPISIVTLGLFFLVINALMLMLTSWLFPRYSVDGFWTALLGSIIISVVSSVLNHVTSSR